MQALQELLPAVPARRASRCLLPLAALQVHLQPAAVRAVQGHRAHVGHGRAHGVLLRGVPAPHHGRVALSLFAGAQPANPEAGLLCVLLQDGPANPFSQGGACRRLLFHCNDHLGCCGSSRWVAVITLGAKDAFVFIAIITSCGRPGPASGTQPCLGWRVRMPQQGTGAALMCLPQQATAAPGQCLAALIVGRCWCVVGERQGCTGKEVSPDSLQLMRS